MMPDKAAAADDFPIMELIEKSRAGDPAALDRLFSAVYRDLRDIAARHMHSERPDHTLEPTALVHEAFLRLSGAGSLSFADRNHYMRAASLAMRRILVDHARARNAAKREGSLRVTLDDSMAQRESTVDVLALTEALERLRAAEPRCAEIVELRFFTGLEVPEVAKVLGISAATVKRDWRFAKAWLARELGADHEAAPND